MTTTTTSKVTYAQALTAVLENQPLTEEMIVKLTTLRDSYVNKAANKKPTKKQVENDAFLMQIVEAMDDEAVYQCKDLITLCNLVDAEGKAFSPNRISAIMKRGVDKGLVEIIIEGRKPNQYKLAH